MLAEFINTTADFLYSHLLIVLLLAIGLFFTVRTRFVQFTLLGEALRTVSEKAGHGEVSSFGALMVSTASRVGIGNIVGVSAAICLGGCGAVFWMWLMAVIGGATAFIESTLAQIYKRRGSGGVFHGGTAYYIEAVGGRMPAALFCLCMIVTYGVGFDMLSSHSIASAFAAYSFYDAELTPVLTGAILSTACFFCILGGRQKIVSVTELLVPIAALMYILAALIIVLRHLPLLPQMLSAIWADAFHFRAIFSGFGSSCVMYGIRRGLFSNEAGIGSAPNAAAAAAVSHPVKQGLAQMLSVFIDTLLICSATAFMCLCSGLAPSAKLAGLPYVQEALSFNFGPAGTIFASFSLIMFAFTTLVGNFFYIDSCVQYLCHDRASGAALWSARLLSCAAIFAGACAGPQLVWNLTDILMGAMCLINLPALLALRAPALACLHDYLVQKRLGQDPVYTSTLPHTECWNQK